MNENFLSQFCKEKDFIFIKSLNTNFRKNTAVVLVKSKLNDTYFVLKIYGEKGTLGLNNELSFYEKYNSAFILKPKIIGKNFICLDYFDGSLRDIIDQKLNSNSNTFENLQFLKNLQKMFDWFHTLEQEYFSVSPLTKNLVIDSIVDRIGNLIASGPKGTTRPSFEYFLLRQIYKLFFKKFKKNLEILINDWTLKNYNLLSKFSHNDLHCRNILIEKNTKNFKIIDFENLTSPGAWISDLLYFYATLYACFLSDHKIKEEIRKHAIQHIIHRENRLNQNDIKKLVEIFFLSAEVNSRWRLNNQGINFTKILNFAFLLLKFK